MRSPTLLLMRMNAADTRASRAMADCTALAVVCRSPITAEIETFINEVSTTSTNIAMASRIASRRSPAVSALVSWSGFVLMPSHRCRASGCRVADHAAEADVGRRRVDLLALSRRRSIAQAVVRRAQVRASLDDSSGDLLGRIHVARWRTAPVGGGLVVARGEGIDRPFPDVAGDIEQSVAVRRERPDRRRPLEAVECQVLPRELALPGVRPPPAVRSLVVVAPREDRTVEPAARRELPFGFGGQLLARPGRVGLGVLERDMDDGMAISTG